VRVRLLVVGDAPPGLAEAVAAGLQPRFDVVGPESARIDLKELTDPSRAQVDALRLVQLLRPADHEVVLAMTGADLFAPSLAYVFGLSPLGERRGVVSWARLRPGGGEQDSGLRLVRRALTEALHEIGHALSLTHCGVGECAMHRSLWPEAVDLKEPAYCPSCAAELASRTAGSDAGSRR